MNTSLFKKWWLLTIKGILILALGIFLLSNPYSTTAAAVWFIGITLMVSSILHIIFSWYNKNSLATWKWQLAEGIFDLLIAIIILAFPETTLLGVAVLVGFWLLFVGIFQSAFGWRFRNVFRGWKYSIGNGVLAMLIGLVITFYPMSGVLAFATIFGVTLIALGIYLILTSWRMKVHIERLN